MAKKNQVWCITDIDKFGKVEHGYKSLKDIELYPNKTLEQELEQVHAHNDLLSEQVVDLTNRIDLLTEIVSELQEATKQSFSDVVDEINKEKFL